MSRSHLPWGDEAPFYVASLKSLVEVHGRRAGTVDQHQQLRSVLEEAERIYRQDMKPYVEPYDSKKEEVQG